MGRTAQTSQGATFEAVLVQMAAMQAEIDELKTQVKRLTPQNSSIWIFSLTVDFDANSISDRSSDSTQIPMIQRHFCTIRFQGGFAMSQATIVESANQSYESLRHPQWSPIPDGMEFEDTSPFGLQGLARDTLQIIKPDCINRLAVRLALRATREQIQDPEYVNRVLSWHPDWVEEYQVVHLIERSLWIQGQSDLVMTMTQNPSQIPDNPPQKIRDALSKAYVLHPDSTIWYGVPLFSEAKNEDGLPIPVTAAEVRSEARRRIEAAQQHALRWGWLYRAALAAARVPSMCWHTGQSVGNRIRQTARGVSEYWNRCRQDARRRARAIIIAEQERCRFGCSHTEIPEHRTWLGQSLETACVILELTAYQASLAGAASPYLGMIAAPLAVAKFAPLIFVPLTVVACDPFLFVELPDEPGKLRHLGHWYWQTQPEGGQKLHLHA